MMINEKWIIYNTKYYVLIKVTQQYTKGQLSFKEDDAMFMVGLKVSSLF